MHKFSTFIAAVLLVCGLVMVAVGIANRWPRHALLGAIAIAAGIIILTGSGMRTAPFYDPVHRRFYRYVTPSESPNRAPCPRCYPDPCYNGEMERSPMIITTSNKHRYGVYCDTCKCEVWFDLETKKEE